MGADLGERAGDEGTFWERRVRKPASGSTRAQGMLRGSRAERRSGDRGAGQGEWDNRKHHRKQCRSRDPGSGSSERGSGSQESGLGSGERGAGSREPGARRSRRPRRGTVPEDEARKRRRSQGRGPARAARTRPPTHPPCPRPPLRSDQGPASPPPRPPAAVPRAGSA